jgi:aminoglycoside 6-adenylyltransferase
MRTEQEMFDLILGTARADDRIRAVILNGSRADPEAPRDPFQDFDIVYIVEEVESFRSDPLWIRRFGELMILQKPGEMGDPPSGDDGSETFLMQFTDGNRIDLRIFPLAMLPGLERESLSILLLDKDGIIEPFPPPGNRDHLPQPPTARQYADCCNEFWWVCPYAAKGLWRQEMVYARTMLDRFVREQLMKMLAWHVGAETDFSRGPGKFGKNLHEVLEPEIWQMLEKTYSDARCDSTWDALFMMCDLFRIAALRVAGRCGFDYPQGDDERVSAHLRHVRSLPPDAKEIYQTP